MYKILFLVIFALSGCTSQDKFFKQARDVTYLIKNSTDGNGSAVLIAPSIFLTAAHVAEASDLSVVVGTTSIAVKTIAMDKEHDIAIMQSISQVSCPCATLSEFKPNQDEDVFAVGFPVYSVYHQQVLTNGKLQGFTDNGEINISTPAFLGNSGGGLFVVHHSRLYLLGIITGMAGISEGFSPIYVFHLIRATGPVAIKQLLKYNDQ